MSIYLSILFAVIDLTISPINLIHKNVITVITKIKHDYKSALQSRFTILCSKLLI